MRYDSYYLYHINNNTRFMHEVCYTYNNGDLGVMVYDTMREALYQNNFSQETVADLKNSDYDVSIAVVGK